MKPRDLSHTQTARVGMHDLMLLTRKARRTRIDIILLAIGLDWIGWQALISSDLDWIHMALVVLNE
jgi:hypothetical protein